MLSIKEPFDTALNACRSSVLILCVVSFISACSTTRTASVPHHTDNLCALFKDKPRWFKAAQKSTEYWGGNIQLPMAIIYQESTFKRDARPKRNTVLDVFPGKRASNAYGYAQALKGTWGEYEQAVGSRSKRRDNFAHAFDFVQWYITQTQKRNKVSKWDYDAQYLNYHEGQGGYSRGTHLKKPWLLAVAKRVDVRATRYGVQLAKCKGEL